MKNKKNAFSLIELSIVVLIIGILIAGVTQSSRLIASSRISTAQSLTQSSPVSSNQGLMLWLETSLDESFLPAEASNGSAITVWNDTNTQSTEKFFARTSSGTVTYRTSAINGLPSLLFDGISSEMTLSNNRAAPVNATIQTKGTETGVNNFTFFVVYDDESTASGVRGLFHNGVAGTNGWGFGNSATANNRAIRIGTTSTDIATNFSRNPTITSATYNGATVRIFNNSSAATQATVASVNPSVSMIIGGGGAGRWNGFISEIIIFDSVLKDDDRRSIEEYLSRKYAINLN